MEKVLVKASGLNIRPSVASRVKTGKKDTVDYVLEEFKKKERECLDSFIDETTSCCLAWLREGINAAMDQYNRRS